MSADLRENIWSALKTVVNTHEEWYTNVQKQIVTAEYTEEIGFC